MRGSWLLVLLLPLIAAADEGAELKVKPLLCIVDERAPVCELDFTIAWKTLVVGNYCVRAATDDTVRCWENADNGDTKDARRIEETFSYRLQTEDDAEPLAEATVEVVSKTSDDRRRRRRSRHVWDIL